MNGHFNHKEHQEEVRAIQFSLLSTTESTESTESNALAKSKLYIYDPASMATLCDLCVLCGARVECNRIEWP
jgi:hypothetical protein